MRYCPSCSAENADDASRCAACGRTLPPLPARRQTPLPAARPSLTAMGMQPQSRPPARVTRPLDPDQVPPPPLTVPPPSPANPPPARARQSVPPPVGRERSGRESVPPPVPAERSGRASTPPPVPGERSGRASTPPPTPAPRIFGKPGSGTGTGTGTGTGPGTGTGTGTPTESAVIPPPTRIGVEAAIGAESPPPVDPVPEAPDSGIVASARYTIAFARSRWQRGQAIRYHRERVRADTGALDGVLYELGTAVRGLAIETRPIAAELKAIDEAETRRAQLGGETVDLQKRQAEENVRFAELEAERQAKVADAEGALAGAEAELETLEGQRRALRDKRKLVERQQKGYLDAAEKREADAGKLPMGDERGAMRRSAEDHRREAAALDPERQEIERKLAALDKPHAKATAKVESLKAELVAARRSLEDARAGHRHRLAELDAEQGRKGKELQQAAGEIHQRLVTLGTIVNLNRVERPELDGLYRRIDSLRDAIGERSRLIDRMAAERDGYERGALFRGAATLFVAVLILLTIVLVVVATV
jgi:hypothetical protein